MKIASRATPECLAGHMWPAGHSLSTTGVGLTINHEIHAAYQISGISPSSVFLGFATQNVIL